MHEASKSDFKGDLLRPHLTQEATSIKTVQRNLRPTDRMVTHFAWNKRCMNPLF